MNFRGSFLKQLLSSFLVATQILGQCSLSFASDSKAYNALVDAHNNALAALYSDNDSNIAQSKTTLQEAVKNSSDLKTTDAYQKSYDLLDRLDRVGKVKEGLGKCSINRCDPKDTHCIDLKIDQEIISSAKDVSYASMGSDCSSNSNTTPFGAANTKNLEVMVKALKNENERNKTKSRSSDCAVAREARSEYLLNRVKTLMRLLKRYKTEVFLGNTEPSDEMILGYAVDQALKCNASTPNSYCNLVRANLKEKGQEFLISKENGLGSVTRTSPYKVANDFGSSFRRLNVLYLDAEKTRTDKCNSAGYSDLTEKDLNAKHAVLATEQKNIETLYSKLKTSPNLTAEYNKRYQLYQQNLKNYNTTTETKLAGFKKYNSFCSAREKREYGHGGAADEHIWTDRRNMFGPTKTEVALETKNFERLKTDFGIDYLRLLGSSDGMLITTKSIGGKKNAFKTLKDGIEPASAIDENITESDVKAAIQEAIGNIKEDFAEMEKDFPFDENTSKLSNCGDQLQRLSEKDPLAISKALMEHPEGTSAVCSAIVAANAKAQTNENVRTVVRYGTMVALGVGAIATGGALIGASPAVLAGVGAIDLALAGGMGGMSAYNWSQDSQSLHNATLKTFNNQTLNKVNNGDIENVLNTNKNLEEAKTNTYMNAAAVVTPVVVYGATRVGTKIKSAVDGWQIARTENAVLEGTKDVTRLESGFINTENAALTIASNEKNLKTVNSTTKINQWHADLASDPKAAKAVDDFKEFTKNKWSKETWAKFEDDATTCHFKGKASNPKTKTPADFTKKKAVYQLRDKLQKEPYNLSYAEADEWAQKLAKDRALGVFDKLPVKADEPGELLAKGSIEYNLAADKRLLNEDPYWWAGEKIKRNPTTSKLQKDILAFSNGEKNNADEMFKTLKDTFRAEDADHMFNNKKYFIHYVGRSGLFENLQHSKHGRDLLTKIANDSEVMDLLESTIKNEKKFGADSEFVATEMWKRLQRYKLEEKLPHYYQESAGRGVSFDPDETTNRPLPKVSIATLDYRFKNAPQWLKDATIIKKEPLYHRTLSENHAESILNGVPRMKGDGLYGEGTYFSSEKNRVKSVCKDGVTIAYELNPSAWVVSENKIDLSKAMKDLGVTNRNDLMKALHDKFGISAMEANSKDIVVMDRAAFKNDPFDVKDYVQNNINSILNVQSDQIIKTPKIEKNVAEEFVEDWTDLATISTKGNLNFQANEDIRRAVNANLEPALKKIVNQEWTLEDRSGIVRAICAKRNPAPSTASPWIETELGTGLIQTVKNSPLRDDWIVALKANNSPQAQAVLKAVLSK